MHIIRVYSKFQQPIRTCPEDAKDPLKPQQIYVQLTGPCPLFGRTDLFLVQFSKYQHSYIDAGHRNLCSNEMHTGLYLVRATGLKRRLEEAADSTANKLLDQIQTMARDSNDHICQTYTRMAAGIGVVRIRTTANVDVIVCCIAVPVSICLCDLPGPVTDIR